MAALTVVINETVEVFERLIVEIPVDLNEINKVLAFHSPSRGHRLYIVFPIDVPMIADSCCDYPTLNAFIHSITSDLQHDLANPGGQIDVSYDDGETWVHRGSFDRSSRVGTVIPRSSGDRNLGDPKEDTWDTYSQVTVEMYEGETLESRDRQAVLAGANMVMFDGEIRSFSTAVETTSTEKMYSSSKVYILTDWIRLQFNTTRETSLSPDDYSLVFDLTGPSTLINLPYGDADSDVRYRARDNSFSITDTDRGLFVDVNLSGENLRPRAVSPLFIVDRDSGDNITISWSPVTREPCPQIFAERGVRDQDATTYDIDILSGLNGSVLRTLESTANDTVGYPEPAQVIDFGSAQSLIFFTVTRTSTWSDSRAVEGQG